MFGDVKIKGGSFRAMGLDHRLVRNIPYKNPTPIQRKTLPLSLEGRSLVGVGRTGSGKTLCYLIPAIQRAFRKERTLVIVPTRELAVQTKGVLKRLTKGIKEVREMIDIKTPGAVTEAKINMLVVDEIDRILEEPGLRRVFEGINETLTCQKIFFSATLPDWPLNIKIVEVKAKINDTVGHVFFYVPSENKEAALLHILDKCRKTLIFVATRYAVEHLLGILRKNGFESGGIYSSMDDEARRENLKHFSTGMLNILVVTDVAARGLDIPLLNTVVNYDLCDEKTFVHRVGRVRGMGTQYCFVSYTDVFHFFNIQETHLPGVEIGTIPQEYLDSYDLTEFAFSRSVAMKGHKKSLEFRKKVSVPPEYKKRIGLFKIHSMFAHKKTLSDKLKDMNEETVPVKERMCADEKTYRDQTFIPYSRKDSRIHTSTFGIAKDDYVVERKKKHEFSVMKKKRVSKGLRIN